MEVVAPPVVLWDGENLPPVASLAQRENLPPVASLAQRENLPPVASSAQRENLPPVASSSAQRENLPPVASSSAQRENRPPVASLEQQTRPPVASVFRATDSRILWLNNRPLWVHTTLGSGGFATVFKVEMLVPVGFKIARDEQGALLIDKDGFIGVHPDPSADAFPRSAVGASSAGGLCHANAARPRSPRPEGCVMPTRPRPEGCVSSVATQHDLADAREEKPIREQSSLSNQTIPQSMSFFLSAEKAEVDVPRLSSSDTAPARTQSAFFRVLSSQDNKFVQRGEPLSKGAGARRTGSDPGHVSLGLRTQDHDNAGLLWSLGARTQDHDNAGLLSRRTPSAKFDFLPRGGPLGSSSSTVPITCEKTTWRKSSPTFCAVDATENHVEGPRLPRSSCSEDPAEEDSSAQDREKNPSEKAESPPSAEEAESFSLRSYSRLVGAGVFFALKVQVAKNKKQLEDFAREVDNFRKLKGCGSIVQIMDHAVLWETLHLMILMELGACDLSKFLSKYKNREVGVVARIWSALVRAVAAAHEQDIIHRDLKPQNFLLVPVPSPFADRILATTSTPSENFKFDVDEHSGEGGGSRDDIIEVALNDAWTNEIISLRLIIKLSDFGLAQPLELEESYLSVQGHAGTLNYLAPETVQPTADGRRQLSKGVDIWVGGSFPRAWISGFVYPPWSA